MEHLPPEARGLLYLRLLPKPERAVHLELELPLLKAKSFLLSGLRPSQRTRPSAPCLPPSGTELLRHVFPTRNPSEA